MAFQVPLYSDNPNAVDVGRGLVRNYAGTNPAAGVEISESVPTGKLWVPLAFTASLATSSAAATRTVRLIIDDGTTNLILNSDFLTQTASLSYTYWFSLYYGINNALAVNNNVLMTLPYVMLPAGFRMRTATVNFQSGDNWGAPAILIQEFDT